MRFVPTLRLVLILIVLAVLAQGLWSIARQRPQDMPWTALALDRPVGLFTGRKLAALREDFPACRAALDAAGVDYTALPARRDGAQCGYADGVRRQGAIAWRPTGLGVACPVAAALVIWEREVVQPAALARLGTRVTAIDHFGSYSCRRLYGRDSGNWSEHASAAAIDVAGFRLADGSRVTVVRDWQGSPARAAFLRDVRDGACRLFSTTLSPDYNAAHRDHLHLDQAARGATGWRACR